MNNDIVKNKELVQKYPWLQPRNVWTDELIEDYDYSYTLLDDMPTGWRKAFGEQMCEEIHAALGDKEKDFRVLQIKEKYGGLRFYTNFVTDEVYNIITKYEILSESICIECGAPATKISKGWILPFCNKCYNSALEYDEIRK